MHGPHAEDSTEPDQMARALRQRIPLRLWGSLDAGQRTLLLDTIQAARTRHSIEYRVSFGTLFWGRWYIALFAGRERRSRNRLASEGQTALPRQAGLIIGLGLLVATYALFGVITFAYLLKSALGIDLSEDASVFHPLYEWFYGR